MPLLLLPLKAMAINQPSNAIIIIIIIDNNEKVKESEQVTLSEILSICIPLFLFYSRITS